MFRGDTTALEGYNEKLHILLDARDEELYGQDGSEQTLRVAHGVRVPFASALEGISGSAVWRLGRPHLKVEQWTAAENRVVGVQTSVYPQRGVIRVTRWGAVNGLIVSVFPDVKPAIEMLEFTAFMKSGRI